MANKTPKAKAAKPVDTKTFDFKSKTVLERLIYAVQKDIELGWNGELKYSPNVFQSYDNLLKDKESQGDGLKNRFTISDETKQYLTFFFSKMIDEIKNIELVETDTIDTMRAKLTEANVECYADFMFGLSNTFRGEFGVTLQTAGDPTQWFRAQICGLLPKYATSERITSLISAEFNDFLKAIAWLLGMFIWYKPGIIDGGLFLATIAQQGMNQEMLDVLAACLREKPPSKPKVPKKKTGATAEPVSETNANNENPEPVDNVAQTEIDSGLEAALNLV